MLRLASGIILVVPVLAAMATPLMKRASAFFNPVQGGGSWLDNAGDGFGEPLNVSNLALRQRVCPSYEASSGCLQVVISGESSADVLTDDGIINFARALGL